MPPWQVTKMNEKWMLFGSTKRDKLICLYRVSSNIRSLFYTEVSGIFLTKMYSRNYVGELFLILLLSGPSSHCIIQPMVPPYCVWQEWLIMAPDNISTRPLVRLEYWVNNHEPHQKRLFTWLRGS